LKKITADFLRQEVTRFGAVVAQTSIFHPCGLKLHSTGDVLTLAHAKALREALVDELILADFREDPRKSLGIQQVPRHQVAPGDVLAEDIRNHRNELILAAGAAVEADGLARLQDSPVLAVAIRHRQLPLMTQRAQAYLAQLPAPSAQESGTRVTRVSVLSAAPVRYLLLPRAKVLVAIADDLLRIFLTNALVSEGHEVAQRANRVDFIRAVEEERPHLVILDLEGSEFILPEMREMSDTRIRTALICAPEGRAAQIHNALLAGANDWMPRPPSRDVLNEKLQACQGVLGRRVQIPPSLRSERRSSPREAAKGVVEFRDPELSKPLPVTRGDLMDRGAGGLRIDYNRPAWPCPWAYEGHGVHPNHFFYAYSTENPMGRDLLARFPGPRNESVERPVRVMHVTPTEDLEIVGLKFSDGKSPPPAPEEIKRAF
jgi:DNA-binding NarL/FixJ family response regulator